MEPKRGFDLWSIMRHYGAPTKILGWSASAAVALYFACSNASQWDKDGAIWIANVHQIGTGIDSDFDFRPKLSKPWVCRFVPAGIADDRMISQQGFFSVCNNVVIPHDWALAQNPEHGMRRLLIPAGTKPQLLQILNSFNVNARTLLHGIEGLTSDLSNVHDLWIRNTWPETKES